MTPPNEVYLGDGLYASFDGFMITLRAPRMDGAHWVGLEPDVYRALVTYAAQYAGWGRPRPLEREAD